MQLSSSAQWVPAGHSLSLSWEVDSLDRAISNVQLACAGETGLEVIESVPERGSRQIIFTRPGIHTFTLTSTFGEGVKHCIQIRSGKITVDFGYDDSAFNTDLRSGGTIIAAGCCGELFALAQMQPNGVHDPDFNNSEKTIW